VADLKLTGIPETMLWTLHNRVGEAMRKDGIIKDDKAVEIYKSIDYDYEKSFGNAEPSHALRAIKFDQEIGTF
jgi:O-methyltransferase involved in polyketide biosynthesis